MLDLSQEQTRNKKVAIIGLGNMGKAIAQILSQSGYDVYASRLSPDDPLSNQIKIFSSLQDLLKTKMPVIVAVKPKDVQKIIEQIFDDRLIISIAAGISYANLKLFRKIDGDVIRTMPNMPLQIKQAATAIFSGDSSLESLDFVVELFNCMGTSVVLQDENLMHAVTAVSGSGPAYLYLLAQSMEDGGVLMGLPRELSRQLTQQTLFGATQVLQEEKYSPQDYIHEVTSPAGTTITALKVLKQHGFEYVIQEAMFQAGARSDSLNKSNQKK